MASAEMLNELSAQIGKKEGKSDAEQINVIESKSTNDDSSKGSRKKNKKGGLFSKVKKLVKKPGQKKQSEDIATKENGHNREKLRTKSTSDLTEECSEEIPSPGSDSKHKRESHGIAGFFERKIKIRSSWKGKLKGSKNKESSSEPVSPVHHLRAKADSAGQINAQEREELATINKSLADDSFFQVSLTGDIELSPSQHNTSRSLDDLGEVAAISNISKQNVTQDKIRLAPKGRRKPTKFNSKTDVAEKPQPKKAPSPKVLPAKAEKKSIPDLKAASEVEPKDESSNDKKKPSPLVPKKPLKSESPKQNSELDLSIEETAPKIDLSDIEIIKTPREEKPRIDPDKLGAGTDDEFGSWEHLAASKSDTSLEKKAASSEKTRSSTSLKKEDTVLEKSLSKSSWKTSEHDATNVFNSSQETGTNENKGESSSAIGSVENIKVLGILDLIDGKTEKAPENSKADTKEEAKKVEEADEKHELGPSVFESQKNAKAKSVSSSSETEDKSKDSKTRSLSSSSETNTKPFDALVSRTRRVSEEPSESKEKSNDEQSKIDVKKEVKFNAEKVELKETSSKNISFEINEKDDIRSADLRPTQIQRSQSLSAVKQNPPSGMSKSNSMDQSFPKEDKESEHTEESFTVSKKLPDWVAIANAKHKRNADDEETVNEQTNSFSPPEIEKPKVKPKPPPVKDKPILDKKFGGASSKIPKPAFKSQSTKAGSSSTEVSKLPTRNATSFKVASPVSSCLVCDKPAYQFERCDIDGQVIHKNCAKCSMCSRSINVGTIRVVNAKLYCGIHARTAV